MVLPADYVAEHVELGYATTAHRAQGRTVDTAHAMVSPTTTREVLYVAATRGRHTNHLYVDTRYDPDPQTAHDQLTETHTARDVLAGVLANEGADAAAHETIRRPQTDAESIATLPAEYQTIAAAAQADRWDTLLDALRADRQASSHAVRASDAHGPLLAAFRRRRSRGLDIDTALPSSSRHDPSPTPTTSPPSSTAASTAGPNAAGDEPHDQPQPDRRAHPPSPERHRPRHGPGPRRTRPGHRNTGPGPSPNKPSHDGQPWMRPTSDRRHSDPAPARSMDARGLHRRRLPGPLATRRPAHQQRPERRGQRRTAKNITNGPEPPPARPGHHPRRTRPAPQPPSRHCHLRPAHGGTLSGASAIPPPRAGRSTPLVPTPDFSASTQHSSGGARQPVVHPGQTTLGVHRDRRLVTASGMILP